MFIVAAPLLRLAPDHRPLGARIDQNQAQRCAVESCGFHRHSLGALCKRHRRNYEATGHPTAPTIRRGTWRPWVLLGADFVSQQLRLDHPGIAAGIQWCAHELLGQGLVARRADPRRPHTVYSRALACLRAAGVGPDDFLIRLIAAHAFRQWDEENSARSDRRMFPDDEYLIHQTAKPLLHPAPLGAPKRARRDTEEHDGDTAVTPNIGLTARRYTYDRVNAALGVLALRSADEINRRLLRDASLGSAPTTPARISNDAVPFSSHSKEPHE